MKKIVLGLVLVVIGFMKLHAGSNVAILPSTVIGFNGPIVCSSTTATLLIASNVYRKGVAFKNTGSYSVRLSTFASTSQSVGYTIDVSGEFSDNIEAYNGAWYGISTSVSGSSTVDVIEKQGVIYQ